MFVALEVCDHYIPAAGQSFAGRHDKTEQVAMSSPMLVLCPYCARESSDLEFCDHCNRELGRGLHAADSAPQEVTVASGDMVDCRRWHSVWPDDPQAFFVANIGDMSVRVHGVSPPEWGRLKSPVSERAATVLSVLAPLEIIEADSGAVVLVQTTKATQAAWDGLPGGFRGDWLLELKRIVQLCQPFAQALRLLHDAGYVWLNFDPQQLEVEPDLVRIANLDLGLFRFGECPDRLRISPQYSPPEVCNFVSSKIGRFTDVYHLASQVYYWIAGLPSGFPGSGLDAFGHEFPALRIFQPLLPPGIAPVVMRGLSLEPSKRFATVDEFVTALARSVELLENRYCPAMGCENALHTKEGGEFPPGMTRKAETTEFQSAVDIDIGGMTCVGPAKSALGCANQDAIVFGCNSAATWGSADRQHGLVYAVVADGVSTARAGNGEKASAIACSVFKAAMKALVQPPTNEEFEVAVLSASCSASADIIAEAMAGPDLPEDLKDSDLMSTTAVVGVCCGDQLHVANIGDSRLYLISGDFIEQLTVDGDVAGCLLGAGVPPEQVAEMGPQAKALRYCLGAATSDPILRFQMDPCRCAPQFGHWPLLAGDIVVLCSDGLIDEGVFLEPDAVMKIVHETPDASAQQLAEQLVAAAGQRQRLPSPAEPQGFGDNISCIVIKSLARQPAPS